MKTPSVSPSGRAGSVCAGWTQSASNRYALLCAAALFLGLVLRLWFIHYFSTVTGDSLLYGDIAHNLIQHGVYGFSRVTAGVPAPPRPTLIRLPGYPFFVSLCFLLFGVDRFGPLLYMQAILDLGTCCLISALISRLFGLRAALIALWIAALCPFTANFVAMPLTETLTLFTIATAFYALHRWQQAGANLNGWLYVIAAALAYSILLRPEQGLLAAAVVPALFFISWNACLSSASIFARLLHAGRPALLVSLLSILPLIPWTVRNERTFHVFQPLAPRFATDPGDFISYGFQRWYRTWAIDFATTETTYWNWDSDQLQIADLPNRAFDSNAQYVATEALFAEYNETTTASAPLDDQFEALASIRIRTNPIRYYVALPFARLLNMAFRPRIDSLPLPLEWWDYHDDMRSAIFSTAYASLNLAYFLLAGFGIYRLRVTRISLPEDKVLLCAMLATVLMRSALLLTVDDSEPRYTIEFYPVLILFASAIAINLGPQREPAVDPDLPSPPESVVRT